MYTTLATQGRERVHNGLAGIDSSKLKNLRNSQLKECFNLIDEMRHKMEFVARIKGISFVDDAASRSALSTWYALETIEGKAIWIVNGAAEDKKIAASFKRLRPLVANKIVAIICLGDTALYDSLFGDIVSDIRSANSMNEAVHSAFYSNHDNSKILFSPAYENGVPMEEQGNAFKREVNEL